MNSYRHGPGYCLVHGMEGSWYLQRVEKYDLTYPLWTWPWCYHFERSVAFWSPPLHDSMAAAIITHCATYRTCTTSIIQLHVLACYYAYHLPSRAKYHTTSIHSPLHNAHLKDRNLPYRCIFLLVMFGLKRYFFEYDIIVGQSSKEASCFLNSISCLV